MASHIGAPSNRRNYHQLKGAGIRTTPDQFGKDMEGLFKTYTDDVVDAIVEETKNIADEGVKMLRGIRQPEASSSGSARPMNRRQWRNYSGSWSVKERSGVNFYHTTIRNYTHYRLTHLLEYGHATRNGTTTRAFRHIKPVDEYCIEKMKTNIPKIIQKGGKL